MSTSAFNTQSDLGWADGSPGCDRSYLPAAMRAAVIALVLLAVLALVVLF